MDIAIRFAEDFSDPHVAGQCIVLSQAKGAYTLGRCPLEKGAVPRSSPDPGSPDFKRFQPKFDIPVQVRYFSRSQATLTFSYDAFLQHWTVVDAGLNEDGVLVAYEKGCQVNGVFIPRNEGGVPDPQIIDSDHSKRILIGGDPSLKILVVPECETTLIGGDPFQDGLWGDQVWSKISVKEDPEEESGPETVSFSLNDIPDARLRGFIGLSNAAGKGLVNKETRWETLITFLAGFIFLGTTLLTVWALTEMGLNPFQKKIDTEETSLRLQRTKPANHWLPE